MLSCFSSRARSRSRRCLTHWSTLVTSWSGFRRLVSAVWTFTCLMVSSRRQCFPSFPGHETSGLVEAAGEDVSEVAVGDWVSVDPTLTCGECRFCANGQANLCENWNASGVAHTEGSTAEFQAAPVKNVHQPSQRVDLNLAALIEPLACAIRGYDLLSGGVASTTSSTGQGPWGWLMAQLAPRIGAATVTVVDRNPDRLDVAAEVGVNCSPPRPTSSTGQEVGTPSSTAPVSSRPSRTTSLACAAAAPSNNSASPQRRHSYLLAVPALQRRNHSRRVNGRAELLHARRGDVRGRRHQRPTNGQPRIQPRPVRRRARDFDAAPDAAFRSDRTPRHPKHSFEDWRDTHRSFCESAAPCWPPAPSPKPPHRWWQRSSEDIIETARTLAAASPAPDSTHR